MQRSESADEADFTTPEELEDICAALRSMGHTVVSIDFSDPLGQVVQTIESARPDVILNTSELIRGELRPSGAVPSICALLGIPCTGPDAPSIALGADKWLTKRTVAPGAVRFAADLYVRPRDRWDPVTFEGDYPVLVKPNFGGSSQGIDEHSLARTPDEVDLALHAIRFGQAGVLIESFISGLDVTVGCVEIDGRWQVCTPITYRTPPTNGEHFMTQALKTWEAWDQVQHEPAELTDDQRRDVDAFAVALIRGVGARGVARVDFRLSEPGGSIHALEINAIAGLQSEAGLSRSAVASGIEHQEMLSCLLASASA